MLKSNRMVILSGFNQTVPFKPLPDLMVFSSWIFSLFVLTSIIIASLYTSKYILRHSNMKRRSTNYFMSTLLEISQVIFLTQPLKNQLLGYSIGTFLLIWTSRNLSISYCSHLNTKQLIFKPPHLIKSYEQIEMEQIQPLYTSEMNDFALIENSCVYDAEFRIKLIIHYYGINASRITIQADPNAMAQVALKLQHQRDVILINEQVALLTKIMMCAVTHNIQPNLTFYSHMDEQAANNNLQVVYGSKFLETTTGKKFRQFINRMYMSSQIGGIAFRMMDRLADIFYSGASRNFIARHKKTCASNYFQVLDPSIDPVENVIAHAEFYLIALAFFALFFEFFFRETVGLFLNHNTRSNHGTFDQFRRKPVRPQWLSSRDKIHLSDAPIHVFLYSPNARNSDEPARTPVNVW